MITYSVCSAPYDPKLWRSGNNTKKPIDLIRCARYVESVTVFAYSHASDRVDLQVWFHSKGGRQVCAHKRDMPHREAWAFLAAITRANFTIEIRVHA